MKEYENNQKLSRAVSILLGTFILIGIITPVKADAKLSPGLDIIASEFSMAVDGVCGTEVYISEKDFKRALGVDTVGKITIVSLPDTTLGRLQIGSRYVEIGQTISERNLDSLKFVPFGSNEICASFEFCRGSDVHGTVYTCNVYTTLKVNTAPYFDSVGVFADKVEAYSGVAHLGTLSATDNDGDSLSFEIIEGASHGKVQLTDKKRGYYEYTSTDGFEGIDSFTVRVSDKYGNCSSDTKITLTVSQVNEGEVFADMDGHYSNAAVISCVRTGVIEAASDGECYYPNEDISRAEFLSLAMRSAGYTGFSASNTGFADDSDIPVEYKGYAAAAEAFGFINGIDSETGRKFFPNNRITRLEAAVILSRITGIKGDGATSVFADNDTIPAWAESSLLGLHSAGILRGDGSGNINAYGTVTRGSAVQMIYAVMNYNS